MLPCLAVRKPGATEQTLVGMEGFPLRLGVDKAVPEADAIRCESVTRRPSSILIVYTALKGQLRAQVELSADDSPLCRLRCRVENRSSLEVIRIDFPRLGNVAIGDWQDDEAILPQKGGERVRQPAAQTGPKMLVYPSSASMGWLDLCDQQAGVYLAVNDQRLTLTEIECGPAAGKQGSDLCLRTHTLIRPGESKTREFVLGVHPGDWHWAADRYREYAATFMTRPDNPDWVKWTDGWVGTGGLPFKALGATMDQARGEGFEYIQQWGQMADGIDQCCGNFSWPAPGLGSEADYVAGVAAVHQRGGKITGYCPSRLWTRDSAVNPALRQTRKEDLPEEARALIHPLEWFEQWRLYPLDGKPLQQYDDALGWFSMCAASDGWHDHLRFWVVEMFARRWHMDGAYIDELAAARGWPCFNLSHGHADIGDWAWGHVRNLKVVTEEGRKVNPDFCVSIEGCADVFGQYANLHLISGLCTRPEVFHYTFPEYILISGFSNNSPLTPDQRVMRAFLNGDRFDSRLNSPPMQTAMALRQCVKRWLYPARFMDTVGLTLSTDKTGDWDW
jgi:hypothetical protein